MVDLVDKTKQIAETVKELKHELTIIKAQLGDLSSYMTSLTTTMTKIRSGKRITQIVGHRPPQSQTETLVSAEPMQRIGGHSEAVEAAMKDIRKSAPARFGSSIDKLAIVRSKAIRVIVPKIT